MKYKLRKEYSKNPEEALNEILIDRGVTDLNNFIHPTKGCELNPYDLDNIVEAAALLLKHLKEEKTILFVVD